MNAFVLDQKGGDLGEPRLAPQDPGDRFKA